EPRSAIAVGHVRLRWPVCDAFASAWGNLRFGARSIGASADHCGGDWGRAGQVHFERIAGPGNDNCGHGVSLIRDWLRPGVWSDLVLGRCGLVFSRSTLSRLAGSPVPFKLERRGAREFVVRLVEWSAIAPGLKIVWSMDGFQGKNCQTSSL